MAASPSGVIGGGFEGGVVRNEGFERAGATNFGEGGRELGVGGCEEGGHGGHAGADDGDVDLSDTVKEKCQPLKGVELAWKTAYATMLTLFVFHVESALVTR